LVSFLFLATFVILPIFFHQPWTNRPNNHVKMDSINEMANDMANDMVNASIKGNGLPTELHEGVAGAAMANEVEDPAGPRSDCETCSSAICICVCTSDS
jgi:hypothetical protein